MSSLTTRTRDILAIVLNSHGPIAASKIALCLGISPRMVRYSLRQVAGWLQSKGARLISIPGSGVFIEANATELNAIAEAIEDPTQTTLFLSPQERARVATLALLTSPWPIPAKQFQLMENISRTTVYGELKSVKNWLERFGLLLDGRPNVGFRVVGGEKGRRDALVAFILANAGEARLLALCGARTVSSPSGPQLGFDRRMATFLSALEIEYSKRMSFLAEEQLGQRLTDESFVSLVLRIAVAIWRVQGGHLLDNEKDVVGSPRDASRYSLALLMSARIGERYRLELGEREILSLAAQLGELEFQRSLFTRDRMGAKGPEVRPETLILVRRMLLSASLKLHPSLALDQQLVDNMSTCVESVLDRQGVGVVTPNPLLGEIRARYPDVFEVAESCGRELSLVLGRETPEDATCNLAILLVAAIDRLRLPVWQRRRILIVCNAGVATSWLLASRIQVEFPNVEIEDVISFLELGRRNALPGVDLIVSSVPIAATIMGVPTFAVNPLLTGRDIAGLEAHFGASATSSLIERSIGHPESARPSLADLMDSNAICLKFAAGGWLEVVRKAGSLLQQSGSVEPVYIEAMESNVRQYGPYMVVWPGIALLHAAPRLGVRRTSVSLVTLYRPVDFGHPENDPVDIALALAVMDGQAHRRALLQLAEVLRNRAAVETIRSTDQAGEILDLVSRFPYEDR